MQNKLKVPSLESCSCLERISEKWDYEEKLKGMEVWKQKHSIYH